MADDPRVLAALPLAAAVLAFRRRMAERPATDAEIRTWYDDLRARKESGAATADELSRLELIEYVLERARARERAAGTT